MLNEVKWAADGTYSPGKKNSPEKLFNDCLNNSCEFDLQLGYFSSATISVLSESFATFISRGGKMRLVINQIVTKKDKDAICDGVEGIVFDCVDLSDFNELRKTFDEYEDQFFRCLSYMISEKIIDIRIIKPIGERGIAHTKSGQFRDGSSVVSFTGSANFTISGLFNNIEEIKIDLDSSLDPMVQNRISNQRSDFDRIMEGKHEQIEYLSPDSLIVALSNAYATPDVKELLNAESQLKKIKEIKFPEDADEPLEEYQTQNNNKPKFPFDKPREYQEQAYENWKNNGQKGLFAMATGTGKTITALNCLLHIYKSNHYYKAIILVPTLPLMEQWENECRRFKFNNIIKISSKCDWRDDIGQLRIMEKLNSDNSYVIIVTYNSFARNSTFDLLKDFPKNKLLIIADEAHNMGSATMKKRLKQIKYLRRIGLSATPERQFDDEGNAVIKNFFNVGKNYTFEYNMEEAIKKEVLCKYFYYPHVVKLTDDEMYQYTELSEKIAKMFAYSKVCSSDDEILTALLLKRKRIIHKAVNKKNIFRRIVEDRFKEKNTLKYTLVYVPEGLDPEGEEEGMIKDIDDESLIDQYTRIIGEVDENVTVRKFTSDTKDRSEILSQFANGELHVLTSMKCLDEGVDVPRSEMAIFCSSTGNPRQFIQRRGRILRTHKDKKYAVIHDLVVVPEVNSASSSFNLEKRLLRNELKRVQNFSLLSENSIDTINELEDALNYYSISLFEDLNKNNNNYDDK